MTTCVSRNTHASSVPATKVSPAPVTVTHQPALTADQFATLERAPTPVVLADGQIQWPPTAETTSDPALGPTAALSAVDPLTWVPEGGVGMAVCPTRSGSTSMPTIRERDLAVRLLKRNGVSLTVPSSTELLAPIPSTRNKIGYLGVARRPNGRFQATIHDRAVGTYLTAYEAGAVVTYHLRHQAAMEDATVEAWDPGFNPVWASLFPATANKSPPDAAAAIRANPVWSALFPAAAAMGAGAGAGANTDDASSAAAPAGGVDEGADGNIAFVTEVVGYDGLKRTFVAADLRPPLGSRLL